MRSRAIQGWHMFKFCVLTVAALAGCFISVSQAQPIPVPMSPENFDIDTSMTGSSERAIQFGEFLGRRAVYLPSGFLKRERAKFRDGTLDVDVARKPGGLFVGIAFRVESEANMEIVYLRPTLRTPSRRCNILRASMAMLLATAQFEP